MKVRDIISQLREYLNNVNIDQRFTNQYLHSCIITATKLIVKRESETRKLFRSVESFQSLDCIEMISYESKICAGILLPCSNVMRSKFKIPKAFLSSTGSILLVYSIDRSVQFWQSSPSLYSSISKREFKGEQKYFWIIDDYLYIPDSYITNVTALGLFIDNSEVDKFNGSRGCKFMDSLSSIPSWLEEDVLKTALQTIAGVTKRIPEDTNPNLNSNN